MGKATRQDNYLSKKGGENAELNTSVSGRTPHRFEEQGREGGAAGQGSG